MTLTQLRGNGRRERLTGQIGVRLNVDAMRQLAELADRERLPVATVARRFILDALDREAARSD